MEGSPPLFPGLAFGLVLFDVGRVPLLFVDTAAVTRHTVLTHEFDIAFRSQMQNVETFKRSVELGERASAAGDYARAVFNYDQALGVAPQAYDVQVCCGIGLGWESCACGPWWL